MFVKHKESHFERYTNALLIITNDALDKYNIIPWLFLKK